MPKRDKLVLPEGALHVKPHFGLRIWGDLQRYRKRQVSLKLGQSMNDELGNPAEIGEPGGWNHSSAFLVPYRKYVQSKLGWNPQADVEAMIDEFMAAYSGSGARQMREYFDWMHREIDRRLSEMVRIARANKIERLARGELGLVNHWLNSVCGVELTASPWYDDPWVQQLIADPETLLRR